MNQAKITHLVSKLSYKILPKPRRLRNANGPEGRILKLQKTLSTLIKFERIELNLQRAEETRGYVDLLISQIIKHGSRDKRIMEIANFWILDKQVLHKLIHILIPRYKNSLMPYTIIYESPKNYPDENFRRAVLELKGHPFPIISSYSSRGPLLLQNILVNEAKKQYCVEKFTSTFKR